MKTVNFDALEKMITNHDGCKLTDIDRAYAKGYIEASNLFAYYMLSKDTVFDVVNYRYNIMKTVLNEYEKQNKYKLSKLISMESSSNSYKVGDQVVNYRYNIMKTVLNEYEKQNKYKLSKLISIWSDFRT